MFNRLKRVQEARNQLVREYNELAGKAGRDSVQLSLLKSRIRTEYNRHIPAVTEMPWEWLIGNEIRQSRFTCAVCPHIWPCPSWYTLREIHYGKPVKHYRLEIREVED